MSDNKSIRLSFDLLTESEFASLAEVSMQTVQTWRSKGTGPVYVRLGRSVYYLRPDIEEWIRSNRQTSTSEPVTPNIEFGDVAP